MEQTYGVRHIPRLDKVLVRSIQAGGKPREAVWDYIFHHWTNYFVGTIRRYGGSEADAREMIGEIFEPIERALCSEQFRYQAPLQSYMNRAVLYQWLTFLRKRGNISAIQQEEIDRLQSEFEDIFNPISTPLSTEQPADAHDLFDNECYQMVLSALQQKLPLKHTFYIQFKVEGYSQKEIADKYKKSLQTVKNYVRDSKIFIKEWFAMHPDCMN